jgi:hypothetical protein
MLVPVWWGLLSTLGPAFCQSRSDRLPAGTAGEASAPSGALPPVVAAVDDHEKCIDHYLNGL